MSDFHFFCTHTHELRVALRLCSCINCAWCDYICNIYDISLNVIYLYIICKVFGQVKIHLTCRNLSKVPSSSFWIKYYTALQTLHYTLHWTTRVVGILLQQRARQALNVSRAFITNSNVNSKMLQRRSTMAAAAAAATATQAAQYAERNGVADRTSVCASEITICTSSQRMRRRCATTAFVHAHSTASVCVCAEAELGCAGVCVCALLLLLFEHGRCEKKQQQQQKWKQPEAAKLVFAVLFDAFSAFQLFPTSERKRESEKE